MTKDLYKDIESTIQSCFVATKIIFSNDKNSKLFLYQLGTDELESFFGVLRTLSHSKNCDLLELIERIKIALQIQNVYSEHPEWRKQSRISSNTTDDHSSSSSWTGDLNN